MHAAKKYDYTKDNRFSTYASWWIKEAITRAIDQQSREIRVPVHVAENIKRVQKSKEKNWQRGNSKRRERGDCTGSLADRTEARMEKYSFLISEIRYLGNPVGEDV